VLLNKELGSSAPGPAVALPADPAEAKFGTEEDEQVLEIFLQRLRKEGSS
jgi:hypothetical protein